MEEKKRYSFWFGLSLIVIAILVIYSCRGFPNFIVSGKKLPGPKFFPYVLCSFLIIGGLYEILIWFKARNVSREKKPFITILQDWGTQNIILLLLGILIYVPAIQWLGFAIGTILLATILLIRLKASWLKALTSSVILVVVIILIFEKLFRIQLPDGIFNITF